MIEIKGYDDYDGDKIIADSPIKTFISNKIIFEDGSEITFDAILTAPEKYSICSMKKINAINELIEKLK